ncbi:hypothetical protein [Lacrimispora sp.]|uniref:hypothetical protein n=1 Tax=Lacrimispora sp. TaxID=2719234 RepID=UPI002FDAAF77
MAESNCLIKKFRENFCRYKEEPIVVYGISPSTKEILDNCREFKIFGLLDGYQKHGRIYDYNIVCEEDLIKNGIKNIVVIARASSVKIIYNRIKGFCKKNNINLYDINGTNLIEKFEIRIIDDDYKKKSYEELLGEIDRHDVISFDIFDTILMRKVLYPMDVFEILARKVNDEYGLDFVKERVRAERELLSGEYPSLQKIYERFMHNTALSYESVIKLMELEFDIEKKVIVPRYRMIEAYKFAISKGKRVFFVSDMYLSREHIKVLLDNNSINEYEDIIVSSEYGRTKCNGLFCILKDAIKDNSCLHIGDNYEADVINPPLFGIDSYEVKKASEMMAFSSYYELEYFYEKYDNRVLIGLFVAEIFNDPFAFQKDSGKVSLKDVRRFSRIFIAPIVTKYLFWLKDNMKKESIDFDKILFLARDGYLIEKMYQMLCEKSDDQMPDACYFLTSRTPCIVSEIYNENDIERVLGLGYDGKPEDLLRYRFLLVNDEIQVYHKGMESHEYVMAHKSLILQRAEEVRTGYKIYAKKQGIVSGKKVAVFDLAASGTCQSALERLFEIETFGYYFVHIKDNRNINIRSLFSISTWFEKEAFICESYILLENILTSTQPTLLSFSANGEPTYAEENRTINQRNDLDLMHQSIMDFFEEYLALYDDCQADIKVTDKMLSFIQNKYTDLSGIPIINGRLNDEFYNRSYEFRDFLE